MGKKILLISDNKIFGYGGGCLEERKYYDGLRNYSAQNHCLLKVFSIDSAFENLFPAKIIKKRSYDILSRIFGHSSYMYFAWIRNRKAVIKFKPDLLVIGRSRMGFIAKDIKKYLPTCRIVCNMENVEYDYVDGYFTGKLNLLKKLYIFLEKKCVKRDEAMAVKYADKLNFLTIRDRDRTYQLYKQISKNQMILPICIEKETKLQLVSKNKTVVFIGSLNYASNIDALVDFIENVWKPYFGDSTDVSFVIGGSNPTKRILELIENIDNCILYANFNRLEDIVPKDSMMIAPIRKGAGMKVKVAETLSMGLIIAASDEALVGYEKAIENAVEGSIFRANTHQEYVDAIKKYCNMSEQKLSTICKKNKAIYEGFYSYTVSRKSIYQMCNDLL